MSSKQKFVALSQKLNYATAYKSIKNGDLFFTGGNYAFSQGIKKLSASDVSHVGLLFWWGQNLMVLESVGTGVRAVPLFHYTGNYDGTKKPYDGKLYIARHRQLATASPELVQTMLQVSIDLLTFQYDNVDVRKILLSRILGNIKRKDNDAFICSEYVAKVFEVVNIKFAAEPKSGFILPEHIAADPMVDLVCELTP